jgi:hypothetical protein
MAQTISLPVQFTFRNTRASWLLAKAVPCGWPRHTLDEVAVKVVSPDQYKEIRGRVLIDGLPLPLRDVLNEGFLKPVRASVKRTEFPILLCIPYGEPKALKMDPWHIREDLLSLKRSTEDLLTFLNRYGAWAGAFLEHQHEPLHPQTWTESEIWATQDRVKNALQKGAKEWFKSGWTTLELRTRPDFPHFFQEFDSVSEALSTSISIDFLRGVRFRICPRIDCGSPFPADRKGKRYCSQYCAHLVSVRRNRRLKSQLQTDRKEGS